MATPSIEGLMSADGAVVHTEGLTKSYDGADAVKALDLVVPRHSIFGFLGPIHE